MAVVLTTVSGSRHVITSPRTLPDVLKHIRTHQEQGQVYSNPNPIFVPLNKSKLYVSPEAIAAIEEE